MINGAQFNQIRRVLVIKYGAFGDVILAQGAMQDIRTSFPNANIAVLSEPAFDKIWKRCPFVDEVLTDAREPRWRLDLQLRLRRKLREFDPEYVVDLQNSSRTSYYRRWLLPEVPWSFIQDAKKASSPLPKSMPSLERKLGQLQLSGLCHDHVLKPDISWMANGVADVLQEAGVKPPFITLIPGCSARHPQKRWPHYDQLAHALLEDGYDVVTVPGPDEMDLCGQIPGKMLTGAKYLDWFDLTGVLKASAFVIGNDTGPTHIASHLERPGLALFGAHTSAASTSITSSRLEAIEVSDLSKLDVETVLQEVRQRLSVS